MDTVKLVPVSEWVYDLYLVTYWTSENPGARVVGRKHFASSYEGHLAADANEACPHNAGFMTWEVVRENVGQPRVVGRMHGQAVYETSLAHGQRLAEAS